VTITLRAENAAFVAGQDGEGPWRVLTASNGAYALEVVGGHYGLAWVCAEERRTYIFLATPALTTHDVSCRAPPGPAMLSGVNAGLGADEGLVWIGEDSHAANGSYVITGVTHKVHDIVSQRGALGTPRELILRRSFNVTGDATVSFDFATEGIMVSRATLTVNGATGSETVLRRATLRTSLGTKIAMGSGAGFAVLPTTAAVAGDTHVIEVEAEDPAAQTLRGAIRQEAAPTAVTIDLPAPWTAPTIDDLFTADHPTVHYGDADSAGFFQMRVSIVNLDDDVGYEMWSTFEWHQATGAQRKQIPDLTSLPGWQPQWKFMPMKLLGRPVKVYSVAGGLDFAGKILRPPR
jgi:hypothetical protein